MNRKSNFFLQASLVGGSTALMMLLNYLKILYVARTVPLQIIGEFAIFMSVFGALKVFSTGGLSGTLVHVSDLSKGLFTKMLFRSVLFSISLCVILVFLLNSCLPEYATIEFYISICLFPLLSISSLYRVLLDRNGALANYNIGKVVGAISNLILTITLLYFDVSLSSLISGLILQEALIGIIIVKNGRFEENRLKLFESHDHFKWSKGVSNIVSTGVNYIGREVDVYALKMFYSMETLGAYFIIKSLVSKPIVMISSVLTSVGSHRLRGLSNLKSRIIGLYGTYLAIVMLIYIAVFLIVTSSLDSFFQEGALLSQFVISLVFVMNYMRSTMVPFGALILASGDFKRGLFWNLLGSFSLIVVTFFLSYSYPLSHLLIGRSLLFMVLFISGIWLVIKPSINKINANE